MSTLQRIGYVVVFVKNWDEAMRFYTDTLGIEVVRRRDPEGFAEFRFPAGGPTLTAGTQGRGGRGGAAGIPADFPCPVPSAPPTMAPPGRPES